MSSIVTWFAAGFRMSCGVVWCGRVVVWRCDGVMGDGVGDVAATGIRGRFVGSSESWTGKPFLHYETVPGGMPAATCDSPAAWLLRSSTRSGGGMVRWVMREPDRRSSLVVVANRLPVRLVRSRSGNQWTTSPGGLVSALRPALQAEDGGSWVGWTGSAGIGVEPFDHDGMWLVPVPLSRPEIELFYEGFSNGTLWPLYHDAIAAPEFHRSWWESYVAVNRRFADRAAAVAAPGAVVWVHDYQLQLVPGMLRESRPDLRIGFFLHIPFPARELFLRLPWRRQIADGLLGADLIGFQTTVTAHNFRYVVPRVTEATVSGRTVLHRGRSIQVGTFPVGIDAPRYATGASSPATERRVAELRELLGHPEKVLLGIDRLDYTKGIEVRLRAFRELLEDGRVDGDRTVLVQIAEPSRGNVHGYSDIRGEVERLVGDINGSFSPLGQHVVHYLHQAVPFDEVVALYRLADVMLVTPFRDGMNLVAKEYVASRVDGSGVLVLSEFAGASHELKRSMLVNPYDIDGVKATIERAVRLPLAEQRRRMRSLSWAVRRNSATDWADGFLASLRA